MRYLLAVLLLVHGLIHVLGVAKQWQLFPVPALAGKTLVDTSGAMARVWGGLWLLGCVLFVVSTLLVMLGRPWWVVGLLSVGLSQALIVVYWQDAKAGTVANVLVLLAVALSAAQGRFHARVDDEVAELFARAANASRSVVTAQEVERLPPPVARWLTASDVVGKHRAAVVRLRQQGIMRTAPGQAGMPAVATQYFSVDPPGFVWRVEVKMARVVPILGRDRYASGKGHMLISALGLVPVVDAKDARIDQGTMLRFLGEMVWFPSAALAPYLTWEGVDAEHARATMTYGGVTASAVFHVDMQGRYVGMEAQRYYGGGDTARLLPWRVPARAWSNLGGLQQVPTQGDVVWTLPEGAFNYYPWTITALDINPDGPYVD